MIFAFFAFVFAGMGQDKVYFMDGRKKVCTVESISPDEIVIKENGEERSYSRKDIILVEYKNGKVEVFNLPKENLSFDPKISTFADVAKPESRVANNYFSINTLALCNADISGFYEYMPKNKLFAVGVMGAYNFNLHSTLPNLFITVLNNPRKNYDIGLTCNVFPLEFEDDLSVYMGVMVKYTDFSYDKVTSDTTAHTVSYSRTGGHQLATIFTVGTHTYLNDHFYIRTLAGLGGFMLRGDYKEQFNIEWSKGNNKNTTSNIDFLPKIYLGVNIGFSF